MIELFGLPFQTAALFVLEMERRTPGRAWRGLVLGIVGGLTFTLKPSLLGVCVAVATFIAIARSRSSGPGGCVAFLAKIRAIDATSASPLSIPLTSRGRRECDPRDATYGLPPGIDRVIAFVNDSYRVTGTVADGWPVYRRADRP